MKKILSITIIILFCSISVYAQFPEDALRLSYPGLSVGARSLGLGTAFTSVANDFSAVYWNPAGLGQMKMNEISMGLSYVSYGNTSTFFDNQQKFTNSSTSINSVGMVYPFPTTRGSLVFAVGYGRQVDFTTGLAFMGLNPSSSIVQSWAPDGARYPSDLSNNIAYQLYLANIDTINGVFDSKLLGHLTQSGKVLEGGGLNTVSVAAASEVAKNFFIGGTLSFITGSYTYARNYYEDDYGNQYTVRPFDFKSLTLNENIESDLSGVTVKLGILYKFNPMTRLGITVKTPSWITVRETYSQRASSLFDNGDNFSFIAADMVNNEYDVTTPFVFSAGISRNIQDLMLAADIEYTDWTQIEFRNASQNLLDYNTTMKEIFKPTANFRLGAEYLFSDIGLSLRGGFAYLPSPYEGDPSSFARKYITGGLGFVVEDAVAIDIGYAHGSWDSYRVNYDASSKTNETVSTNNLIGTVSYRF